MIFNTKAIKEEYFKYNYKDWTRPNLAANGTVGSDNYAVRASSTYGSESPYKAFNGNMDDDWSANSGDGGKGTFIEFYSPVKINVTSLEFTNRGSYIRVWHKFNVLGSNDGIDYKILGEFINENATANATWKIDVNTREAVKYIKIIGLDTGVGSHDTMGIKEIKIFGREYVNTVPGTSTDYDVKKTNGGFIKDIYAKGNYMNFQYFEKTLIYNRFPSITFLPKETFQEYNVHSAINKLKVECVATKGMDTLSGGNYHGYKGGKGGKVECILDVSNNRKLFIYVGKNGENNHNAVYNAVDIRTDNTGVLDTNSLQSRLIVAGAGGNAARQHYQSGGNPFGGVGGGLVAGEGGDGVWGRKGFGGTQTAGGQKGGWSASYGMNGKDGALGIGGEGINYYGNNGNGDAWSGSGGAGWYGGGSGGGSAYYANLGNAGGGGGSSYTNNTLCSNVVHTQGFNEGEGYVIITPLP